MDDIEKTQRMVVENFAKLRKLLHLQAICAKAALPQNGARDKLIARIADAAKISTVDFTTVELEDL
jgi:hypothetical protein